MGGIITLSSPAHPDYAGRAVDVLQQKQGCVKPTMQMEGRVNINDDIGLEDENTKIVFYKIFSCFFGTKIFIDSVKHQLKRVLSDEILE